jgi:hypothetical protein
MLLDFGTDDFIVPAKGVAHCLRVAFPTARAPLDVREQKDDRTGRNSTKAHRRRSFGKRPSAPT